MKEGRKKCSGVKTVCDIVVCCPKPLLTPFVKHNLLPCLINQQNGVTSSADFKINEKRELQQ